MKNLLKSLRPLDWLLIFITMGLVVLSVYLELLIPDYMGDMTRALTSSTANQSEIWKAGGYMLLCSISTCLVMTIVYFLSAKIGAHFSYSLRKRLYQKVNEMSEEEIEHFSTASLITRTTNDINQITMLLMMGMSLIIKSPVMAVWAILKILGKGNDAWTIAVGIAVAFLIVTIAIIGVLVIPKFKKVQTQIDKVNALSREDLEGLRVIKAFNAEKFREDKFEKANDELTKTNTFTGLLMGISSPLMTAIMSGLPIAIYWIGAYAIHEAGNMEEKALVFSNMMVFSSYSTLVIMGFLMMVMVFMFSPRSIVAMKRVNEVLSSKTKIQEGCFDKETPIKGELEFKNVSFGYNNEDKTVQENVLSNISFKICKGETLAIIGPTGSGKSTILNLVMRFYDPSEGEILLDGVNLKNYRFSTLYEKIAIAPQKAVLFKGDIKENALYGESHSYNDKSLKLALDVSHSEEFIAKKENGLNSEIEQGGKNVSGGQKQRLSIARALARNPEILLFDDSLSALDYKTDFEVRKALKEKYASTTKIIVAQRIGSIKDASLILVLDEGKVVGLGKHEDLLKTCSLYQEIASSQLNEEELSK